MEEYRGEKYWIRTHGVLIHESLDSCLDSGGINSTYRDPSKRANIIVNGFWIHSKEEWIEKLAFSKDGKLFYRSNPTKYATFVQKQQPIQSELDLIKFKILGAHKVGIRTITIECTDDELINQLIREWFDIKRNGNMLEITW